MRKLLYFSSLGVFGLVILVMSIHLRYSLYKINDLEDDEKTIKICPYCSGQDQIRTDSVEKNEAGNSPSFDLSAAGSLPSETNLGIPIYSKNVMSALEQLPNQEQGLSPTGTASIFQKLPYKVSGSIEIPTESPQSQEVNKPSVAIRFLQVNWTFVVALLQLRTLGDV